VKFHLTFVLGLGLTILVLPAIAPFSSVRAQSITDDCDPIANSNRAICSKLWRQRNNIYADAGYCFKTTRAIREYGRDCTGGKPSSSGMRRVRGIIAQEKACGCR
jgi:YARHG domain